MRRTKGAQICKFLRVKCSKKNLPRRRNLILTFSQTYHFESHLAWILLYFSTKRVCQTANDIKKKRKKRLKQIFRWLSRNGLSIGAVTRYKLLHFLKWYTFISWFHFSAKNHKKTVCSAFFPINLWELTTSRVQLLEGPTTNNPLRMKKTFWKSEKSTTAKNWNE